ncbi:hypothetical protein [Amaricoccus sp. W119]|uniref:hypothetical protein n=1 Tax=Amaricoccus sp. W119 TaxID=3391833 RepID=UPI0039A4F32F
MNINTIYFTGINCMIAEAIFGDTIEILYNGVQVWVGVLNTSGNIIPLPNRRHKIPGGAGGNITINQWYFGQPKETAFTQRVLQSDVAEDQGEKWTVSEYFDGDPGGVYELYYRTTLETWDPSREDAHPGPNKP